MASGWANAFVRLRSLADRYLTRERIGHTLQPTALVHEAFLRLCRRELSGGLSQDDLVRMAARAMRVVLVDHARRRNARKRGASANRVPLDEALVAYEETAFDLVELHEALERLAEFDTRMAQIIELRFFAGLGEAETAVVMNVSSSTISREWKLARHWLYNALHNGDGHAR